MNSRIEPRAFKVEIDLTTAQRRWCERACAASRVTYNWGLAEWRRWYRWQRLTDRGAGGRTRALLDRWSRLEAPAEHKRRAAYETRSLSLPDGKPSAFGLSARLTEEKKGSLAWLHELGNAYVPRASIAALGKAYAAFFRRLKKHQAGDHSECGKSRRGRCSLGAPRFHARRPDEGFVSDEPKGLATGMEDGRAWIQVPGLGRIWAKKGQRLPEARYDAKAPGRPCTCDRVPGTRSGHRKKRKLPDGTVQPACEARIGGWVGDPGVELCAVGIRRWGGRWYAAVQAKAPVGGRDPKPGKRIAVEVGVRYRAVTFDGAKVGAFTDTRKDETIASLERRRKLWERRQARRWKAGVKTREQSKGWHEARSKVAKLHREIAQVRADRIHHVSRAIVNGAAEELVLRDMAVKDLLQRGAASDPRTRNVLADDVQKAGMAELRRQLEYKQRWAGGTTTIVKRDAPETRTCWACGAVRESAPGYPWFVCPSCGHGDDRDTNAAKVRYDCRTPQGDPVGSAGTPRDNGRGESPGATAARTGQPGSPGHPGGADPDGDGASLVSLGSGNRAARKAPAERDEKPLPSDGQGRPGSPGMPGGYLCDRKGERSGDTDRGDHGSPAIPEGATGARASRSQSGVQVPETSGS